MTLKVLIVGAIAFGLVLPANAQNAGDQMPANWQQWQQKNPTYPSGMTPQRSVGTTPQPYYAPPSSAAQPRVQQKKTVGNVQVTQVKIDGKPEDPWINIKVQNLTNNRVTSVYVQYQVMNGSETVDGQTGIVNQQLQPSDSVNYRYFITSPNELPLGRYRTKIVGITWKNADGSRGTNTKWGQMEY
jgi:hypothetical protein